MSSAAGRSVVFVRFVSVVGPFRTVSQAAMNRVRQLLPRREFLQPYDRTVILIGCLLICVAVILFLMDWDGLSVQMPTQVPPRRLAAAPLVIGMVLVAVGLFK